MTIQLFVCSTTWMNLKNINFWEKGATHKSTSECTRTGKTDGNRSQNCGYLQQWGWYRLGRGTRKFTGLLNTFILHFHLGGSDTDVYTCENPSSSQDYTGCEFCDMCLSLNRKKKKGKKISILPEDAWLRNHKVYNYLPSAQSLSTRMQLHKSR